MVRQDEALRPHPARVSSLPRCGGNDNILSIGVCNVSPSAGRRHRRHQTAHRRRRRLAGQGGPPRATPRRRRFDPPWEIPHRHPRTRRRPHPGNPGHRLRVHPANHRTAHRPPHRTRPGVIDLTDTPAPGGGRGPRWIKRMGYQNRGRCLRRREVEQRSGWEKNGSQPARYRANCDANAALSLTHTSPRPLANIRFRTCDRRLMTPPVDCSTRCTVNTISGGAPRT